MARGAAGAGAALTGRAAQRSGGEEDALRGGRADQRQIRGEALDRVRQRVRVGGRRVPAVFGPPAFRIGNLPVPAQSDRRQGVHEGRDERGGRGRGVHALGTEHAAGGGEFGHHGDDGRHLRRPEEVQGCLAEPCGGPAGIESRRPEFLSPGCRAVGFDDGAASAGEPAPVQYVLLEGQYGRVLHLEDVHPGRPVEPEGTGVEAGAEQHHLAAARTGRGESVVVEEAGAYHLPVGQQALQRSVTGRAPVEPGRVEEVGGPRVADDRRGPEALRRVCGGRPERRAGNAVRGCGGRRER
ncbi:hypothetical protein SLI_1560 [Streptomyces lividans 1326]|uniref:Uncharacterized protein n=1 Tax=Streptomyces lividans 1326 TaxID=1200984 RepID=A0A7U9DNN3_STRLI|nr:hypothetical protein SLI_1560 [Streptomyces lividans 1326]